jgi:chromosome segregation ATPase
MILEINDKIDELQFKLETLPNEIKNINFKLLKETVTKAYDDIKEGKNRISCLDKEIQRLRKILGNMWEEKFTTEKKVNNLYLYLHGILGHRETDKLDKKFL